MLAGQSLSVLHQSPPSSQVLTDNESAGLLPPPAKFATQTPSEIRVMGYRIAIDVGGTFTDVVVADQAGRLTIGKGLTTRERIFRGMEQGLAVVAEQIGEPTVSALLGKADLFIYGTTTATNAVIEGKTGKTAFLTTAG